MINQNPQNIKDVLDENLKLSAENAALKAQVAELEKKWESDMEECEEYFIKVSRKSKEIISLKAQVAELLKERLKHFGEQINIKYQKELYSISADRQKMAEEFVILRKRCDVWGNELAKYAERDRWRVTANEPPFYGGKFEAYWPDDNPDFDHVTPEAVYDSRTNRWRVQGLPKSEPPTYYRPLRTDKPKGAENDLRGI